MALIGRALTSAGGPHAVILLDIVCCYEELRPRRLCIIFEFISLLSHAVVISMLYKVTLGAEIQMVILTIVHNCVHEE